MAKYISVSSWRQNHCEQVEFHSAPRSATCFSRTHIAQLIADKSDQVESRLNPTAGELRHNLNTFLGFILASRRG